MTTDTILNKLRAGASIEDIAAEMTNRINEANKLYEEEQKAKEKEANKSKALREAIQPLLDWYSTYYTPISMDDINPDELVALLDSMHSLTKLFDEKSIEKNFDSFAKLFGI